jgi:hypothetical protein
MLTSLAFVLFATMLSPEATAPCEKLTALSLPHTTITSAKFVAAGRYTSQGPGGRQQTGPMLPDHCRVVAVASPSSDSHIEIEIWLPAQGWNGKFLAVGNGGFAGTIPYGAIASGLRDGYATAGTDTGHKGPDDASFGLGHPEKVIDFGIRSMHEVAVQSKAIIKAFYDQQPRLSYYNGCSTGGMQGLSEAQRYPADFNAIIAGAPVYNQTQGEENWFRLFLMPGMDHCRGGIGPDQANFLGAMERWVEAGAAPDRITVSRVTGGQVDMTRPLCPYPQVAKWKGVGSIYDTENFICAAR